VDTHCAALRPHCRSMYGEGFFGGTTPSALRQIKTGQVYDATRYRRVATCNADVTHNVPRLRDYERTRLPSSSSSPFNDY